MASAEAAEVPPEAETLANIPQMLSGECAMAQDCKKPRIQRPKSRKAKSCTIKCVTTCIRGGEGSLGKAAAARIPNSGLPCIFFFLQSQSTNEVGLA
ncbi:hypothetical protein L1049_003628 [Liquidambar formosana]|uniref:Uncharacterized protein n=1 Tax=Liquidambar formosana TaxID=63359 RepID=A0AAP0RMZ0_LIQFO